jgi:hypothetical protein
MHRRVALLPLVMQLLSGCGERNVPAGSAARLALVADVTLTEGEGVALGQPVSLSVTLTFPPM